MLTFPSCRRLCLAETVMGDGDPDGMTGTEDERKLAKGIDRRSSLSRALGALMRHRGNIDPASRTVHVMDLSSQQRPLSHLPLSTKW